MYCVAFHNSKVFPSNFDLYMTKNSCLTNIFDRDWTDDLTNSDIEIFSTFYSAYHFLQSRSTNNYHLLDLKLGKFYIVEKLSGYRSLIYDNGNINAGLNPSLITPTNVDTTDDIDYNSPSEVLKAYRAGKNVDWAKAAERYK